MFLRDHNSITEPINEIKSGELFGEISLICGCKRTATVRTNNYTTLAYIDKHVFQDMCQQFVEVRLRLKHKLKSYNDKLKVFLKTLLQSIPFMSDLSNETLEEVSYHLKQKYYDADEIIYREGDKVDSILFVTRGDVELLLNIQGQEFIIHNLYQG